MCDDGDVYDDLGMGTTHFWVGDYSVECGDVTYIAGNVGEVCCDDDYVSEFELSHRVDDCDECGLIGVTLILVVVMVSMLCVTTLVLLM